MLSKKVELWFALFTAALSCLAFFFWIPNDTETGLIETYRRQTFVGDAFIPTVAVGSIALCAFVQVLLLVFNSDENSTSAELFDGAAVALYIKVSLVIVLSLVLMFWAGPIAVSVFGPGGEEPLSYRQLRATFPWSLIGFFLGGICLVAGVTRLIEGRFIAISLMTAVAAVIFLIIVFQVPFDGMLLPPNGDF